MKMTVLSLFPEILEAYFISSIMAKAVKRDVMSYRLVNIRDFAFDVHRRCDDLPYGGGAGMVLKPEPVARALEWVGARSRRTVYVSPGGTPLDTALIHDLSNESEIVILCGRYEGIDQRVIDRYVTDEVSIGDYVVSSGEVAALVVIDAVYRVCEGVINGESLAEESFADGLLEYPHYTRPADYRGDSVPRVLVSGHHAQIAAWRREKMIEKTRRVRPELIERYGRAHGSS